MNVFLLESRYSLCANPLAKWDPDPSRARADARMPTAVGQVPNRYTRTKFALACVGLLLPIGCTTGKQPGRVPSQDAVTESPSIERQSDGKQPHLKQRSIKPSVSGDGSYITFQSTARRIVPDDTNGFEDVFVFEVQTGQIVRVSGGTGDNQANGDSYQARISADGNYIVFVSDASNLLSDDTNGKEDVFVFDRRNGTTGLISRDSAGRQGNGASRDPVISAHGRYVAFVSVSTNLVTDDTNVSADVFLHDRETGRTTRISVAADGTEAGAGSGEPAISADGHLVAFYSHASNLVTQDANSQSDIFVHDRQGGTTRLVSKDSGGVQGARHARRPSVSADGRWIAFESWAENLVPDDTNAAADIFVHDLKKGTTVRASVDSSGVEGNDESRDPRMSADGRYVVFTSYADNLISNDTNRHSDVFIRDIERGDTSRLSVNSAGAQGNNHSAEGHLTANGRHAIFATKASNLVADDNNKSVDIVIRDREARTTTGVTTVSTRRVP